MSIDPIKLVLEAVDNTGPVINKIISALSQIEKASGISTGGITNIQAAAGRAVDDIARLAQTFKLTFEQAQRFAQGLGLSAENVNKAISRIQQLNAVNATSETQFKILQKELGLTSLQFKVLADEAAKASKVQTETAGPQKSLTGLLFAYNNLTFAVQNFANQVRPAFTATIGQAAELENQILATSAAIASTQKVFQDGLQIKDPTQAIKALQPEIEKAIGIIREGSLELSGVTSNDVIPLFQIVARNASQIGASIDDAAKLSLKFAAGLTAFKIPLFQAQQEIQSILSGQIDQNSALAQQLNIRKQDVELYKSQGKLVEFLEKKLAAAAAGNALQSKTLEGVTSNIQELVENVTLALGKPLLQPLVNEIDELYQFLFANRDTITKTFTDALAGVSKIVAPVFQEVKKFAQDLTQTFIETFQANKEQVGEFVQVLGQIATQITQSVLPVVESLIKTTIGIINSPLGEFLKSVLLGALTLIEARLSALNNTIQVVTGVFDELTLAGKQTFEDLRGLVDGLIIRFGGIKFAIIDSIVSAFKAIPGPVKDALKAVGVPLGAVETELKKLEERGFEAGSSLGKGVDASGKKITTGALDIEKLGTTAEQLEKRVNGAFNRIKSPVNPQDFQAAAKEITDLTNQQLQLGIITQEQAEERLNQIASDARVEVSTQQAAVKAITDLRQQAGDRELADLKAQQAEIEGLQQQGAISELEATKQITALKEAEAERRLEITREAILRELEITGGQNSPRVAQLRAQEKELTATLEKTRVDGRKQIAQAELSAIQTEQAKVKTAIADGNLSELDGDAKLTELKKQEFEKRIAAAVKGSEEQKRLQQELAQFLDEAENRQSQLRLKRFDAEQKKALDLVKQAETERLIAQQELINQGVLREEDAAADRLKIAQNTTQEELKLAKQRLQELERLPKPDGEAEVREREAQIRAERQKTFDLTARLLNQQRDLQRQIISDIERELKRQTDRFENSVKAQTLGLDAQKIAADTLTKSLETQNRLLEARKSLTSTFFEFAQSELDLLTKGAKSEQEKQKLAQTTALLKFRALQQQNDLEKQSLELQLQQEQAALRRQKIENTIAQLRNRADVLKAQANVVTTQAKVKAGTASQTELEAAQIELLAQQQTGTALQLQGRELDNQAAVNAQIANARRQEQAIKASSAERAQVAGLFELFRNQPGFSAIPNAEAEFRRSQFAALGLDQNTVSLDSFNRDTASSLINQTLGRATPQQVNIQQLLRGQIPQLATLSAPVAPTFEQAQKEAQAQQPALVITDKLTELQTQLTGLIKPISDKLGTFGEGVKQLAVTPRNLTLVTQEKQSIADAVQEQGRLIAGAAGL